MRTTCALLLIFLTACVSKYKTDSFTPLAQPLSKSGSACVMLARDGAYGARTYPGSGHTVSRLLHNAILAHMSKAELATRVESLSVAISVARKGGMNYVFEPVILNWEDRATAWSGRPDRITIRIGIWDAVTGRQLSSSHERASSKWATFGGDHPQDLVPHVVETFASRVVR